MILSGSTLYGRQCVAGRQVEADAGYGTVFAVNTDGTGFTTLHRFTAGTGQDGVPTATELFRRAVWFYRATPCMGRRLNGGSSGYGTVFAINTDGTGFTTLHDFAAGSDGANPQAGLILSGNTLYGTAEGGGSYGPGTVFAINTDGTGFTTLYSFTGGSDGAEPYAGLILTNNTLYGTARQGGSSGNGTVFAVNTDGTGFTTLYSFTGGSDGAEPYAGLILAGNTLYGTAYAGGSSGYGTVFSLSVPIVIPSPGNLTNLPASGITSTSAVLNATLGCTGGRMMFALTGARSAAERTPRSGPARHWSAHGAMWLRRISVLPPRV